jgi:prephenate dehydrogenase
MEEMLKGKAVFVGGHPIAGKEKSGVEASQPSLFEGALCILTPTPGTQPEALRRVKALWEGMGSSVSLVDPFLHDRLLALVSHLPHLVAYALVNTVLDTDMEGQDPVFYSGGGFRDFTRIAGSSEEMWEDICLQNRDALVEMIQLYEEKLGELKEMIITGDRKALWENFHRAKKVREKIA